MLKTFGIIALVLIISLAVIAFYLGVFNPVYIEKTTAGPYEIACLDHIGPYCNIGKKIEGVSKLLDEQKIKKVAACGIYYDDPKAVSSDKLRSKGGFVIEDNVKLEILEKLAIPKRDVIIAKIKAHPAIAAIKVYPKINKCLVLNNLVVTGPCVEIYHKNGIVETQMPVELKKK